MISNFFFKKCFEIELHMINRQLIFALSFVASSVSFSVLSINVVRDQVEPILRELIKFLEEVSVAKFNIKRLLLFRSNSICFDPEARPK